MRKIPKRWVIDETHFASSYEPSKQGMCITAHRCAPNGRWAYAEHLLAPEVLQYSRADIQTVVDFVSGTLMKALDIFIERETDANTSD